MSKHLAILLLTFMVVTLFSVNGWTQTKDKHIVSITIDRLKDSEGDVFIAFFNSEETFMTSDNMHEAIVAPGDGKSVTFEIELPAGTFAASVFLDVNNNRELDTNRLGIPKEPYGFSNNPGTMFGPPKFNQCAFVVPETRNLTIKL